MTSNVLQKECDWLDTDELYDYYKNHLIIFSNFTLCKQFCQLVVNWNFEIRTQSHSMSVKINMRTIEKIILCNWTLEAF